MMLTARVEAYKRFEIHDGPGVRTTVFLKGCPLNCRWCHNPECISAANELGYQDEKCLSCGECVSVCAAGAHLMQAGRHIFDRAACVKCGKCADACLGEALHLHGRTESIDEVFERATEDRVFYGEDGGVTVSGGEPLAQYRFVTELLKRLRFSGIHTAVDTCLYADKEAVKSVLPYTDLFLADVKAMDEEAHIRATGVSNKKILENLLFLNEQNAPVEIRIPFVPGYNDDQIEKIAAFLAPLTCITGVKVLPYHDFADGKYALIGKTATKIRVPTEHEIAQAKEILASHGVRVLE